MLTDAGCEEADNCRDEEQQNILTTLEILVPTETHS